jgi:hypothetical protein
MGKLSRQALAVGLIGFIAALIAAMAGLSVRTGAVLVGAAVVYYVLARAVEAYLLGGAKDSDGARVTGQSRFKAAIIRCTSAVLIALVVFGAAFWIIG